MSEKKAEFDHLSESYEQLLADPIRDRFTAGDSQFFHTRKRDLIRAFFKRRGTDTRKLNYLDLGCGKGELLTLLREDFGRVSGCDPSAGMMESGGLAEKGITTRVQDDPGIIPYDDSSFDFATAVCVYHHVPPSERDRLTAEVRRVLKPGGLFAIIEHNPYNPATRIIVSRTPVDADAILLTHGETRGLLKRSGFNVDYSEYFLYLPEKLYERAGVLESAFKWLPFGGQYAVFGSRRG
ncbi:MAG TPA: class I SAM-dependent methyltransferase [Bryobacteraceae bacterium]|nr:class I SAM-dependent methyltransferase [Bryobacteraceae bacterium]